jgi:hypothetical protein
MGVFGCKETPSLLSVDIEDSIRLECGRFLFTILSIGADSSASAVSEAYIPFLSILE